VGTISVLGGLAAAGVTALLLVTAQLREVTAELRGAIESVLLAEELEIQLLRHNRLVSMIRLSDDMALAQEAAETAELLRRSLHDIRQLSGAGREGLVFGEAERRISEYLDESLLPDDAAVPLEQVMRGGFDRVEPIIDQLDRLIEINVRQARESQARADRVTRLARATGFGVAVLLIACVSALLWVGRSAVRPVISLADAMRRLGAGDRAARAPEEGAAELRYIARTFNQMAAALARYQNNQLTFLAGIVHDLRNPLSVLRMSQALNHRISSPDDARRAMSVVQRQVDMLDRLVGDLLDAVRIEAGELELRPAACDVRDLLRDAVELHRAGIDRHRIQLDVPSAPLVVEADPVRLMQVLNNLLSNAIKYSPDGGTVGVSAAWTQDEVRIAVRDEGMGIPSEDHDLIFEPFQRSSLHRDIVPGAGLGLSVSRRIVTAHGGKLELTSSPGSGSTFVVRLQAAAAERHVTLRTDVVNAEATETLRRRHADAERRSP
jgi:two-component system, OmpR family, sensor histidine kinase MtrB